MESRWFNVLIVLCWMSTMSWLMVAKVIPPLRRGDPPNYSSIYVHHMGDSREVAWNIEYKSNLVGSASSRIVPTVSGVTEVHSEVYLQKFPLAEQAPGWMRGLLRRAFAKLESVDLRSKSKLEIDTLGRLVGFHSETEIDNGIYPDPITVDGRVKGAQLEIRIKIGKSSYDTQRYIPTEAMLGDELSPQAQMPGLRLGQGWTVPVFGPFRPVGNPIEILDAKVESSEPKSWNGRIENVLVVVYRTLGGTGRTPRARLWVRNDGMVICQETDLFGNPLRFTRLPPGVPPKIPIPPARVRTQSADLEQEAVSVGN